MPSPPSPESADAIPSPTSRPAASKPAHARKRTTPCATMPTLPRKQLLHRHLRMCDSAYSRQRGAILTLLAIDAIRRIRHLLLCARQLRSYHAVIRYRADVASRDHGDAGDVPSVPPPLTAIANAVRPSAAEEARTIAASTNTGTLATLTTDGDPWASFVTYGLLGG